MYNRCVCNWGQVKGIAHAPVVRPARKLKPLTRRWSEQFASETPRSHLGTISRRVRQELIWAPFPVVFAKNSFGHHFPSCSPRTHLGTISRRVRQELIWAPFPVVFAKNSFGHHLPSCLQCNPACSLPLYGRFLQLVVLKLLTQRQIIQFPVLMLISARE